MVEGGVGGLAAEEVLLLEAEGQQWREMAAKVGGLRDADVGVLHGDNLLCFGHVVDEEVGFRVLLGFGFMLVLVHGILVVRLWLLQRRAGLGLKRCLSFARCISVLHH